MITLNHMTDQDNTLEYNDGIGDLLKEKDRRQFSWSKTALVLIIIVFVIIIILTLIFSMVKSSLTGEKDTPSTAVTNVKETSTKALTFQEELDKIEKENLALINEIENSMDGKSPIKTQATKPNSQTTALSESQKITTQSGNGPFKLIAGTYTVKSNAQIMKNKLNKLGFDATVVPHNSKGIDYFQVQAGAFDTRKNAVKIAQQIEAKGYDTYILKK